jgi:hypothetical protein
MKNLIYLFVLILLFSCEKNKFMYNNDLQISLILYPSGCSEDIRYSLNILNDSLHINDYSTLKEIKYKLKENEYNHLLFLKKDILKKYHRPNNNVLGSWGCMLEIQNVLYYNDDDFNFKDPPIEIKNLIDYLVKLSTIDIELYSFS